MRTSRLPCLIALALALGVAPAALAGEDVSAGVTVTSTPNPTAITANGNPYANGSYAVGTLTLEYTHVGFTFPSGDFASFDLNLALVSNNGRATGYATLLTLSQSGSTNLALTITPDVHPIDGPGWTGTSLVGVSIPAWVAGDPLLNVDGTTLVANLQLSAPGSDHLGTTTSVQVKIRLVHPTSCVRHYTFISHRENEALVTSMALRYATRRGNADQITNVQPSQVNQNILLVNVCGDNEVVDLRLGPDPRFVFGPGGAPANAVFIYSTAGELVPGPIDVSLLTAGPVLGKVTDIPNLTLPGGHSVLVKLHLKLDPALDRFGVGTSPFTFDSSVYEPGGTWTVLHGPTSPNPASADVPFTLTAQN